MLTSSIYLVPNIQTDYLYQQFRSWVLFIQGVVGTLPTPPAPTPKS